MKALSKQDPEKCPAVESICHYANMVLNENNGHLSTWLIARLIKYLIYRVKTKYIGRLKVEADLDRKIDEEYGTIQNTDSLTSSRSTIEPRRAYSSKTEYVFNGKANIRLRADNVPFDGPNLYVVLNGFHNPDLPAELLSVGVPLTCILEIKLSGEKYIGHRETKKNDLTIQDKTHSFEDHYSNEIELLEFWRVTHERFANLLAYPMYSNITVLTIHLPVSPETVNVVEKESLKRDIYDRIFFTLHHLYELYQQHAKYLKNTKLERRIVDKKNEAVDTYDDTLKNIPNEHIGAPLILSAILLQVEHNLATSSDGCFLADHDTGFSGADTRHENTSTTVERSPTFNMQAKLKLLDLEYELIDEYDTSADGGASQSLQPSDLEVIPYGDTLSVIIRHSHDRIATHLGNAVLRVLRNPRIIHVWRNHEAQTRSKSDMYFCHLDNIASAFNQEQRVSREEVVHYLHLLMFDDLIFFGGSREARARLVQPPRDELSELKHTRSTIKRARSVPNFTSPPTVARPDYVVVKATPRLIIASRVSHRQSTGTFHLTTKRGIVLGFYRNRRELVENSSNSHWQNLTFDFRASWPSGLLIEPTIGDGTKNPFYIRQSYVSKRPGRAGAAREVCRNFLRNGTVLKYLDDNTVVIFRPNGVIVTCMDFDKPQSRDESIHETDPKTEFRIKRGNSRQSVATKRGGKVIDSTETRSNGSIVDVQMSKQHVPGEFNKGDDSLITEAFTVGEVLRYSVVNYDGRRYEVLNDLVVSEHDRLLVRTTLDYEVNEVFTRRADDGTCIITGYTIEEQPVICEWTENELRYFGVMKTLEMKEYDDRAASTLSSDVEVSHESSVSIADGFVSILLTFRIEHKDYATVSYDQSAVSCTLSMPDNLLVSISRRGHYEVSMEDQINLKIFDNDAVFWKTCATCSGSSTSTYKFWESRADSQTSLTTGILGDVLEVKSGGTTRYHRSEDHQKGRECNDDILEYGKEKRSNEERDANSEARIHYKHERYCETLKFPARSQYRIFAMNRDLTACEYLHRSVRREQELAAVFGDEMSMIQYPISRRPELRRVITFVPVEPELGSKEMFRQYRVTTDKRTDYDKIELPRGTYSFPYNWLFPFGKKVVSERTRNEVLAKRNEQSLPKLLRVRVFFGIKGAGRSVLIDMQRAMGRYWIPVLRDGDKCRLFYATGSSRPCEVENAYGSLEDGLLQELAVGVKGSIDVETYVKSLQGKLIKTSTKAPRQSSRLAELLRQRGSMKNVYEWYKQCMRKRIIVPYFRNIADSRYFLMKNHADEAISRKSYSCVSREKEDKLIDRNKENCRSFC
ncbi:hypothetical protein ALC62_11689 [Cyphomyrmex costatus]|uniref:Uncharacterized protein n=1 Tax=Cyphomyrmex costatus TaxID=456900 RepID=A0A195C997_9HYME|nr:hypothetical protein ALC62_11689 [Cyphomyrmex costatus]